jgi:hypothetical protein
MDNDKPKKSPGGYVGVPISKASTWCFLCIYFSSPSTKILLNIFLTKVPRTFNNTSFNLNKFVSQLTLMRYIATEWHHQEFM